MKATISNVAISLPSSAVAQIPPSTAPKVPLNGERLDNVAFIMHGNHLSFPDVMKKNNIGFLYDVPSQKKISVW